MKFRFLTAEEVDCRVSTVSEKGCSLLLYKDARCDQIILDETVGPMNWERRHTRENANCIVSLWDKEKNQWVSKEDTGTESFTEKEKGLASDSFKRACFNWGIGRELYTAPFIWVKAGDVQLKDTGRTDKYGKPVFTTYDRFECTYMRVEDGKIVALNIENKTLHRTVYVFGNVIPECTPAAAPVVKCKICDAIIKDTKKGSKLIPAAEVANSLDGMCPECWRKAHGKK